MTDHTTSAGMNAILARCNILTHAEFRLLSILSDFPTGDHFEIAVEGAILRHGFSLPELGEVCASLNRKQIGQIEVVGGWHVITKILWKLP